MSRFRTQLAAAAAMLAFGPLAGLAQASKNGGNFSSRIGADAATFANVPFGFYRGASEGASIQSSANSLAWWTLPGNTDGVFSGTLRLQANADVSGLVPNPYLIDTGVRAIAVRDGVQVGSVFDNGQSWSNSVKRGICLSAFAAVNVFQNRVTEPEPGTWALMLPRFGGVVVAVRQLSVVNAV